MQGLSSHFCFHTDIDECANDDLNNCHEDANCTNTGGSFNCSCNDGYSGSGTECTGKFVASSSYVYIPVRNSSSLLPKYLFVIYLKYIEHGYTNSMMLIQAWNQRYNYIIITCKVCITIKSIILGRLQVVKKTLF